MDTRTPFVIIVCHPWTLDFGIHAEMTDFLVWLDFVYKGFVGQRWERSLFRHAT